MFLTGRSGTWLLDELDEDPVRGPRMQEGDEPSAGSGPGHPVHQDEALFLEPGEFRRDVLHREGKVVQALASLRQESGHRGIGAQRRDELHMDAAGLEKRNPDSRRGDLFDVVERETEGAVSVDGGVQVLHGDSDMMGWADHNSPLALYVPNTARNASLISPSVPPSFSARRIGPTRFASPRAPSATAATERRAFAESRD